MVCPGKRHYSAITVPCSPAGADQGNILEWGIWKRGESAPRGEYGYDSEATPDRKRKGSTTRVRNT